MAQQASSSSPSISGYTYDVFVSFRGEDTRYGFTGHLYSALSLWGIFTFIDDEALQKGEEITPSLRKAIQESRISIVIFSKNYATSTFCLNELVLILECYMKQNMLIFPVFYDIDPSHVRHQTGSYQEAFAMHERGRFKDDTETVQKWRLALHQAANLSGWHFKIGEEYETVFIKKITEVVSSKLNRRPLHIANYPVGLQARIQQIQQEQSLAFYNPTIPLDSEIGEQPLNFARNQEFLYNHAMVPSFAAAENVNAHGEMRTKISEVPWESTHQTRDYTEASWEQLLALLNPTLTIPLGSENGEEALSYECHNSYSHEPVWTVECSNDQDEAFMYNQATVPSFAEMENASPDEPFMHNQEKVPSFVDTENVNPDEAFMYNQAMVPSFAEKENVNAEGEMGTLMSEVSRQFTHRKRRNLKNRNRWRPIERWRPIGIKPKKKKKKLEIITSSCEMCN